MNRILLVLAALFSITQITACGKGSDSSDDVSENAQQIGDVMASIDESSGSSNGSISMLEESHRKLFARYDHRFHIEDYLLPKSAYATSCATAGTFGSCSSGVITRTFGGCTVLGATFNGTVSLTWSNGGSCALGSSGDTITRVPSYTVTGLRGATLAVSKTGTFGQRLLWTSGTGASKVFTFASDGIRRVFTNSSGTTLFDFTTLTTSSITVTGTTRSTSRVISGGSLRVQHNITGVTCDYVPNAVTWSSTCNCPVSGSWSGSCSDGRTANLTLTGCGSANFTFGSTSNAVTFDRCYSI